MPETRRPWADLTAQFDAEEASTFNDFHAWRAWMESHGFEDIEERDSQLLIDLYNGMCALCEPRKDRHEQ